MPKITTRNGTSPKANSKNPKDWTDFEFVDITLSSDDKKRFLALTPGEVDELDDVITTLLEGEYKMSLSPDVRNDCVIASFTCKHETDANYGYVLSSRAASWLEALRLNAFKHQYLCVDGVWPKDKRITNWG